MYGEENGTSYKLAPAGEVTLVENLITFDDLAQLETTIQMGFKEGLTAAMENLDQLLAAQKQEA
ncbi:hypothetical protein [Pontibacter burrus]|uniref:hypothetical protein n=1 Tax=Pontibacter burrus TaxID=2704466 RepID=UPI001F3FAE97|nr:hypothetical protein [Pontibacter burrus]